MMSFHNICNQFSFLCELHLLLHRRAVSRRALVVGPEVVGDPLEGVAGHVAEAAGRVAVGGAADGPDPVGEALFGGDAGQLAGGLGLGRRWHGLTKEQQERRTIQRFTRGHDENSICWDRDGNDGFISPIDAHQHPMPFGGPEVPFSLYTDWFIQHGTVFSVFMEWCQQARDAAAYSPTVIDKYRRTEVKSRSGRDGSEDVVVVAAEYSASTAFNRAKAWQLVVAAYANRVGVRVEDLQQQLLRSSAGSKVEAALAASSKQYAYAKGRLNAAGHIVRAADSDKKSQQRSRSSLDAKKQKQRFAPYDELYDAMEKRRKVLNL